jgi:hypothetical protein
MVTTQLSIERAALVTEEAMAAGPVLLRGAETAFVSETPTGLAFDPETPLEVWAPLVVRLIVQSKRLEFALADAINFGELAYADVYDQWVTETGLNKRTLQNYARIGRLVEPARRRANVSFSHHAEVAALPAPDQEALLDAAERAGMTRYDLRDAARERKAQLEGRAIHANGEPIEEAEPLVWVPTRADLTDEARQELDRRLHGVGKRHSIGYERAWLDCLLFTEQRDAFVEWRNG